jgi:hypothetical protein
LFNDLIGSYLPKDRALDRKFTYPRTEHRTENQ